MLIEELNYQERDLIEILRAYQFISDEGYKAKEISIEGRSHPSVIFTNNNIKQRIHVIGDETQVFSVVIQREKRNLLSKQPHPIEISNYYEYFDCGMMKGRIYTHKAQAAFIKENLMPVIRGEIWIDKLIEL
jgi:hypothetical protein